ncbi:CDP-glycerol glycerophosphotransferase family protein [Shouchella sp. 1P09AA]|uniref:CDP-glycerol glycerophosphotransferase family protein n=1 Tax=unclassified Shouchella TaxID=2893065 RepID=UPI0039A155AD
MNTFFRFVSKLVFRLLYTCFCLLPIRQNQILFASDSRNDLSGNFFYIYKEIQRQRLPLICKFLLKEKQKKTAYDYIQLAYFLATSKKIIVDDYYPFVYPLTVRKQADLIQVWHAVGAFKRFGHSRKGKPGAPLANSKTHRNYTKAIVSSNNVRSYYAEGFGISVDKVKSTGVPRTDVFFDHAYKANKREELYGRYPYLRNKRVVIFAPTFRGKGKTTAYYPFDSINFEHMYEELKHDSVVLFKWHPFVKNKLSIPDKYKEVFYDFSHYREVNDLLFVADVLVTDYSSVCFEFALLEKPMIFFAFDVDEYTKDRDFYYAYQDFIPGELVKTTSELVKNIKDPTLNKEKLLLFIEYFFDKTDGRSSERFVNELLKDAGKPSLG